MTDELSYGPNNPQPSDNPVTGKPYDKDLLNTDNPANPAPDYPYTNLVDMLEDIADGDTIPSWVPKDWIDPDGNILVENLPEWVQHHIGDWPVKMPVTFRYLFAYDDDSPIRAAEQDTNSRVSASSLGANFFAAVRNYIPVSLPLLDTDVKPVSWDWTNAANDLKTVAGKQYVLVTEDASAPATGQVTSTANTTVTFPKVETNTFNRQNFYMGYWAWNFLWSDGETYEARYYPKYANGDLDNSGNVLVYKGSNVIAIRPTEGQPWPQSVPTEDADGKVTMELLETELARPDKTDADAGTAIFKAHGQQDKPAFQLQAWAVRATLDDDGKVVPGSMTYLGTIDTKIGQIEEENGRKVIKMVLAEHDTVLSGCEFNPDSARWYSNSDLAPEHLLNSSSNSSGGTTYSRITDVPLDPDVTNIYAMYANVETRTVRVNFKINGSAFKTYSYVYKSGDRVDLDFHVPVVKNYNPKTWGLSGSTESENVTDGRIHIQVAKLEENLAYDVLYASTRTSKLRVIHLLDYSENVGADAIQAASGNGKRTLTSDFVNNPSYRVILEDVRPEAAAGQLNKEKYALSIGSNGDGGAYLSDVYEIESNDVYNPEGDKAVFVKSGGKWYLNPDEYRDSDDSRIEVPLPAGYSIDDDKDDDIIYTQVIVYSRKAYRLNFDLSGGRMVKTENGRTIYQKALPAQVIYAGQETPQYTLERDQYTLKGYRFMSRADYLALDADGVKDLQNSTDYKDKEKMPPENRMAVAIWKLVKNEATIRVDIYIQSKTDKVGLPDEDKTYDFTYTADVKGMPVNVGYGDAQLAAGINSVVTVLRNALKQNGNPLYQNVDLTEKYVNGRSFVGYFQRNEVRSGLLKGKTATTVPGKYTDDGDNVVRIYYDRAPIRFVFSTAGYRLTISNGIGSFVTGKNGYESVDGLYQAPIKTAPDGIAFTWPVSPRLASPDGTGLTFLTYFAPPQTIPSNSWTTSPGYFTFLYNFQKYNVSMPSNTLTFYKEKLGTRLALPTVAAPTSATMNASNFEQAQQVKASGFNITEKFDGFNIFAYNNNAGNQTAVPNSTSVTFSGGGKIYARRITYTIQYYDAENIPETQTAANYDSFPLSRLYEEELAKLPKLTNDNYGEGDPDYTFAGWSTGRDFYDKKSYVTNEEGEFAAYQDGRFVKTGARTMPSNNLNYIAMWSAPKTVQLMAPAAGTANSKDTRWEQLTTSAPITVQKYTALTGDHNGYAFAKNGSVTKQGYDDRGKAVAGQIQNVMGKLTGRFRVPSGLTEDDLEIRWYLDEKCVMEFDPARDLVIEDNMKLYANLRPDQREQEYNVYYITDRTDEKGNMVYLTEQPDSFWGIVDNASIDRPKYASFDTGGKFYTFSSGELTGQKLTQAMVDNGIYYMYSETEIEPWNFTVYDWLDAGDGVYLRLGRTEYEQILDRRIVFFPDELRGFRLSASYKSLLVEPDEDDGLHTVTDKHKTLNVVYELDETQLAFWGGTFSAGSIGNAPTQDGGKLAFYKPEALGLLFNAQGDLEPQLLEKYLRLGEHLKAAHTGNGDSTALRNEWESGGWKWLWARSNDEGQSFGELSENAYELFVDYTYTGDGTSAKRTVRYPMSGDADSALTVGRTESGSLPSAPGRYSVVAEVYAQIPGDASTKATLYTFPVVTVDLSE